jgi:hypothetical protein
VKGQQIAAPHPRRARTRCLLRRRRRRRRAEDAPCGGRPCSISRHVTVAATSHVGVLRAVATARSLRSCNGVGYAGGRRWCQPRPVGPPGWLRRTPAHDVARG